MKYLDATVAGLACKLLLFEHDWSGSAEVQHKLRAVIDEGQEGLESRRARSTTPLHTVALDLVLERDEADDWRKGIADTTTERIALPIPVDVVPKADLEDCVYNGAQQWVNFDPATGDFVILTAAELPEDPTELTYALVAPLVIGRFAERPEHRIIDEDAIGLRATVREDSPWSCRVSASVEAPAWTAEPAWTEDPVEESILGLEAQPLGLARESVLERENVPPRWRQRAQFLLDGRSEVRTHLAFWIDRRGEVKAFNSFPAWAKPGTDTTGTPHTMRMRFAGDTITFRYEPVDGVAASVDATFLQEVDESESQEAAAETLLLRLTLLCGEWGDEVVERYADWDAPVTVDGDEYAPWPMALRTLKRSVELQNEELQFDWAFGPDTLLAYWLKQWIDFPVKVELLRCNPEADTPEATVVVSGTVREVAPDGNVLRVRSTLLAPSGLIALPD